VNISSKFFQHTREFDSWILEKQLAGIDFPAFFVSNFLFLYIVMYGMI